MRQQYPIKLQVCLDMKTYHEIMNLMHKMYEDEKHRPSLSQFIRDLIQERFEIEEEQRTAVNKLNNIIQNYDQLLNEKVKTIDEQQNHIKHLEMKIRLKEAHK